MVWGWFGDGLGACSGRFRTDFEKSKIWESRIEKLTLKWPQIDLKWPIFDGFFGIISYIFYSSNSSSSSSSSSSFSGGFCRARNSQRRFFERKKKRTTNGTPRGVFLRKKKNVPQTALPEAFFEKKKKKRTTIGTPRGVLIVRILYYNSQNPLL